MNTYDTVNQRVTLIINDYLKLKDDEAARLLAAHVASTHAPPMPPKNAEPTLSTVNNNYIL